MKVTVVTIPLLERHKLYKDVWSRPCTKIAAELGISSSALKRICTEMDIPTPVAGHCTLVRCQSPTPTFLHGLSESQEKF